MGREVVFEVGVPPTEVAARLRAVVDSPSTVRRVLTEPSLGLPYIGEVADSMFSARRPGRNTFKVVAEGRITPVGKGSRVELRMVLPPRPLVIAVCGALFIGALIVVSVGELGVASLFAAMCLLVGYTGIVHPQRDADTMTRVLGAVCSSETVADARSLGRTV
jgi:hypothetical protein